MVFLHLSYLCERAELRVRDQGLLGNRTPRFGPKDLTLTMPRIPQLVLNRTAVRLMKP